VSLFDSIPGIVRYCR